MKKILWCFLIFFNLYMTTLTARGCGGALAGGLFGGFAAGALLGSALSTRRTCCGCYRYPPPGYYYGPYYQPPSHWY